VHRLARAFWALPEQRLPNQMTLSTVHVSRCDISRAPFGQVGVVRYACVAARRAQRCLPTVQLRRHAAASAAAGAEAVEVEELAPAKLQKIKHVKRWIVFSDLHVHARYAPFWRLSLERVHALAIEHDAGCLFLVRHPSPSSVPSRYCTRCP
jgi:hypothetical protein